MDEMSCSTSHYTRGINGKAWQYALVWAVAFSPLYLEALLLSTALGLFSGPVLGLATLLVPYLIAAYHLEHRPRLRLLLITASSFVAVATASFSVLTGRGLTDEWNTPQYVSVLLQGQDWYSAPLHPGTSYWNVYLPLLPFIQVPYVWFDYRWFTVLLWGLMVYAVRNRYYTSIALGGQYPALMAGSGFNDIVPLLFLTLTFVTLSGRRARVFQILSLGLKQFANAFVFFYHLLRRDWAQAGVTVLVTFLFLSPFLFWDWKSAICTPVLNMPPDCQSTHQFTFNTTRTGVNFFLYPVWIAAVFYPTLIPWTSRRIERIRNGLVTFMMRLRPRGVRKSGT